MIWSDMPNRNLALGTISFAICFAAWGLISVFAPGFQADLHLSAQMRALVIAVPVLLGSVARIPMGILSDRLGGRLVFTILFFVIALSAAISADGPRFQPASRLCISAGARRIIFRRRCGFRLALVSA